MFRQARDFSLVQEFGHEMLILDEQQQLAHHFDSGAAAVWRACDGSSDADAIAGSTGIELDRVHELLAELSALDLIVAEPEGLSGQTRRKVIGQMVVRGAGLGLALPAITSIVLPTPAEAYGSQTPHSVSASQTQVSAPSGTPVTSASTGPAPAPKQSIAASTTKKTPPTTKPATIPKSTTPKQSIASSTTKKITPPVASASPAVSAGAGTAGAGAGTGAGGGGAATTLPVSLSAKTLPFTGDNLIPQAIAGFGVLAAGVVTRLKLLSRPADKPPHA